MAHAHDTSYKLLFSAPELVRDLVLGFIPDEWLHSLDYSTLEKMPGSYVTDDLRNRADDVVWRVRAGEQWVYLYILIEFQSTVDPFMAVRIMTYVGLLYQDLIRAKDILPGKKLPPVLPIVLYNGDAKWTAATDIAALIPRVPGLVSKYLPKLEYLLIDESQYNEAELSKLHNLVAAMIRFEHPESPAALIHLIDLLNDWLDGNPELKRTFAIWIRAVLLRHSKHTLVLPKVQDLKELKMTLANRFDTWAQQHEQKGLEKGIEKGEAILLQRQLARRFGPLPAETLARVATASAAELELWGDRVLDAASLEDVLRA
ncbi:MAG: Rpn family recombination-promoting nuclease/putative transposase [Pseudomonas sp.]